MTFPLAFRVKRGIGILLMIQIDVFDSFCQSIPHKILPEFLTFSKKDHFYAQNKSFQDANSGHS